VREDTGGFRMLADVMAEEVRAPTEVRRYVANSDTDALRLVQRGGRKMRMDGYRQVDQNWEREHRWPWPWGRRVVVVTYSLQR
jgi:hypothetical protein